MPVPLDPETRHRRQSEGGRRGLLKRWGAGPRTIDLRDLAPEQRAFIVELVDVAKRNVKPSSADAQAKD